MSGKEHTLSKYSIQNKIKLIEGGKQYFDTLLNLILSATDTIHLQTYIFDDDETGQLIAKALISVSKRNIQVYLLLDGYASQGLSQHFIESLIEAGINFRFFEPIFKSYNYYFGRRLHHKVIVVDAKFAMVGGINVANHYNDMPLKPAWFDFALLVEGDISKELCQLCWTTWKGFSSQKEEMPCHQLTSTYDFDVSLTSLVRLRRNDWVRRKNDISRSYFEMFKNAKSEITIFCSYFLPGQKIRRYLKNASKRGVKIRVVIAGKSDVKLAKNAEKWMYDWLLRNKIELYEYQTSILHAKVAICDNEWMTIGSYNLNDISAFASIELNLDVKDEKFVKNTKEAFDHIIKNECMNVTEEHIRNSTNIFTQFIRWCSYRIFQTVFFLFTFYFKQNDR